MRLSGASGMCAPLRLTFGCGPPTQGSAALRPGLWNLAPSGHSGLARFQPLFFKGEIGAFEIWRISSGRLALGETFCHPGKHLPFAPLPLSK